MIGKMYQNLDAKKKQAYTDEFNKEKKNYEKLLADYEAKHGKIPKKEKSSLKKKGESKEASEVMREIDDLKIPEKPKRNLTAFFCFR